MKYRVLLLLLTLAGGETFASTLLSDSVKTTFQTSRAWKPTIDNRADAVMVYGVNGNPSDKTQKSSFENRVASWKDKGYVVHFMTGIAWGEYQDYFTGKWDGKWHLDEGQVTQKGDTIWHGHLIPYIVPTDNFLTYLKERHIKRVIDAGITAIFMEEPEFWARSGYSDAFKREWEKYYGFAWRPQDASPENTYLANKLKYHLYYKALNEVFTYAKKYGKSKGLDIKCYVPTHSLVNYAQWQIVSPEASLASLPSVDGYIAQVWTGTSREPNYYDGRLKERVFETAFLEYGCMESMTAPTKRKMFFLTDPIEDWPRDWSDYKKNYQATFTAQLLYPNINNYEVMPWPERIYEGYYKTSANSNEKQRIPRFYSSQMQVMINALNEMPISENKVSGTHGIGVLMSNSLMFQRFPVHSGYDDPQLANFYGQTLPFVKRGIPVQIVHLENVKYPEALRQIRVLLMSYANMKPLDKDAHQFLAQWVKDGGVIIYSGEDNDPFQSVQEWWNSGQFHYDAPADHLFESMKIPRHPQEGTYRYGKGYVVVHRSDPKNYVLKSGGDATLIELVKDAYQNKLKLGSINLKNTFYLERGKFTVVAVLDDSVNKKPLKLKGCFIDLFDPKLPVVNQKLIQPGEQSLLIDMKRVERKHKAQVLAAASRTYEQVWGKNTYRFIAKSPLKTDNVSRVLLPKSPLSVKINGKETFEKSRWDKLSNTYLLNFANQPEGVTVEFNW